MNILTYNSHFNVLINYSHRNVSTSLKRSDSEKVKVYEIYLDNFLEGEGFGDLPTGDPLQADVSNLIDICAFIFIINLTRRLKLA